MEEKVYKIFEELGIAYDLVEHAPLFSAKDNDKYHISLNGTVCKSLFIRNKNKSNYYLVILELDKKLDLIKLQELLCESRLSFGSEDALFEYLKITPRLCFFA